MAVAKTARVLDVQVVASDVRLLDFASAEPLGFVGGQYVIIDSGMVLPNGKAVKRAYSLLSSDNEQSRFQLAVKRIPQGPGSGFLHDLEPGTEIRFSGPWGKFFPQPGASGPTLLLATDTGVTATMGLVQSSSFAERLPQTVFVWLRVSSDDFLPERFVRARVPAGCGELRVESIPAIGHPERVAHVREVFRRGLAGIRFEQVFVAGDGAVNYALLEDAVAAGIPATRDNVESFFNMPKKSV